MLSRPAPFKKFMLQYNLCIKFSHVMLSATMTLNFILAIFLYISYLIDYFIIGLMYAFSHVMLAVPLSLKFMFTMLYILIKSCMSHPVHDGLAYAFSHVMLAAPMPLNS